MRKVSNSLRKGDPKRIKREIFHMVEPVFPKTPLKGRIKRRFHRLVAQLTPSSGIPRLSHRFEPSPSREGIALAVIVKNEALYLSEWIAFHCMLGIRHIYIYDNMGDDDLAGAIQKSTFAERVTVIRWGNLHMRRQHMAYNHCIATYGMDYRWIGFLDPDEFAFPVQSNSLPETFEALGSQPCVALHWRMFGTSGHKTRPDGLVIENYTMREQFPPPNNVKSLCKVFVDPSKVVAAGIHIFNIEGLGLVNISQNGVIFDQYCERNPAVYEGDLLRLHHYYSRSEQDFATKLSRGGVSKSTHADERLAVVKKRFSQIEENPQSDFSIGRYVEPLKVILGNSAD